MRHLVLSLCLISLVQVTVSAQQKDFFKPSAPEQQYDQQKLSKLRTETAYKSVTVVGIEGLTELLHTNRGVFRMTLPDNGETYFAETKKLEMHPNGDFEWIGEFVGVEGTGMLIQQAGETFGQFSIAGKDYSLQSFGSNKHVWIAYDETKTYTCGVDRAETEPDAPTAQPTATCADKHVRILVLYTSKADQALANVSQTATLAVANMNRNLINSHAYGVSVSLAGVKYLDFMETDNIDNDLEDLYNNTVAHSLRNQLRPT